MFPPQREVSASGSGSISGDAAHVEARVATNVFADLSSQTIVARFEVSATLDAARASTPDPSYPEFFEGVANITFTTSAPAAPCTTTMRLPCYLAGPCPRPHCM